MQLRAGQIPLNKYLHRIGKANTPLCPVCEMGEESVLHLLITCPAHDRFRNALRYELKGGAVSIATLLTDTRALKLLFQFINQTGRLTQTFGILKPVEELEEQEQERKKKK